MDVEEILISYRNFYGIYHNHKEKMAYSVTALYLTGATAVILKGSSIYNSSIPIPIFILFLVFAILFPFLFILWQLRNREIAANIVQACNIFLARILENPKIELDKKAACYKGVDLPRFLAIESNRIHANRKCFEGPRASEKLTYLAILFFSTLALLSIILG